MKRLLISLILLVSSAQAQAPGMHVVSITCSGSPSPGVAGYNFYRTLAKGSGYAKLATAPTCAYTDATVANSTLYYYVVTAVGPACTATTPLTTGCGESAYSTEATAPVPSSTASPNQVIIVIPR